MKITERLDHSEAEVDHGHPLAGSNAVEHGPRSGEIGGEGVFAEKMLASGRQLHDGLALEERREGEGDDLDGRIIRKCFPCGVGFADAGWGGGGADDCRVAPAQGGDGKAGDRLESGEQGVQRLNMADDGGAKGRMHHQAQGRV